MCSNQEKTKIFVTIRLQIDNDIESQVLFQISDLKCANVRGADGWRAEWSTLSSLTQITMTGWQYLILLEGMVTAQILHRVTIATAGVTQCYMFM